MLQAAHTRTGLLAALFWENTGMEKTEQKSIRTRLLGAVWAVFVIGLGALFFHFTVVVGEELTEDAVKRANREIRAVRWFLETGPGFASGQELDGRASDGPAFDSWVTELGRKLNIRITYIAGGRVLADSEVPYERLTELEDHSTRPEVLQAGSSGHGMNQRYSATLGKEMIYVAERVESGGVPEPGIIRLSVPVSQISDRIVELRARFLWTTLAVLALCVGITLYFSSRLGRAISQFSETALRIGEGDYSRRIRAYPGSEFVPLANAINAMAKKIDRHVHELEDSRGKLKATFDGMTDGVMVLDSEGRLETFNSEARKLFDIPLDGVGKHPLELTRNMAVQDMVDRYINDHEDTGKRMVEIRINDGREVEVSCVPFSDQNGVRKIIMVLHDVSFLRRGERALKDFVANVSHQLRTPLTSIRGYAETMSDNPPGSPEQARTFLKTIERNAEHMAKVISRMLALAKSEHEAAPRMLESVNAAEVARQAVEDLSPAARRKNLTLRNEVDTQLKLVASADGLLEILHALIENAVDYSPEGGEIVLGSSLRENRGVLFVEDEGPGVSEQDRERIFERFYRVDENAVSDGNAGLGLAICRRIAGNMDGRVWNEPRADACGKGTRFCVSLRLA